MLKTKNKEAIEVVKIKIEEKDKEVERLRSWKKKMAKKWKNGKNQKWLNLVSRESRRKDRNFREQKWSKAVHR